MLQFFNSNHGQTVSSPQNGEERWELETPAQQVPETLRGMTAGESPCRFSDREEAIRETGRVLAAARQKCGLTLDELAADTKIKREHLESLEAGRLEELPQLIYVLAYVSKLGKIYNIPEERLAELRAPLRDITYEIPENLPRMVDLAPSEENKVILRRMIISVSVAAFLVLLMLAAFVLFLIFRPAGKTPVPLPEEIGEEQVLLLQDVPQLSVPPAPRKR